MGVCHRGWRQLIRRRLSGDDGQTVLLYAALIAATLFLALAFFAVAQAASVRNGGQTAADAAALAAAQDDRDELFDGFLEDLGEGDDWQDWIDGLASLTGDGCGEAEHFAAENRADVLECEAVTHDGDDGYTVRIRTRFDTGDTIVPGADHKKAEASATAVVKPRCDFEEDADLVELTCEDEDFSIDPEDTDLELKPSDLFSVVLVE